MQAPDSEQGGKGRNQSLYLAWLRRPAADYLEATLLCLVSGGLLALIWYPWWRAGSQLLRYGRWMRIEAHDPWILIFSAPLLLTLVAFGPLALCGLIRLLGLVIRAFLRGLWGLLSPFRALGQPLALLLAILWRRN